MLHALIVEDDQAQQMLYRYTLEEAGFETKSLYDGESAIEYLSVNPHPNLIILDIRMPKVNGNEVLNYLTTHPDKDKINIVIATASSDSETSAYVNLFPSAVYLYKPHVLDGIRQVIRDMQAYM